MNEIENAIETLREIYPTQKQIVTGEYPHVADAIDDAIEALQENQNRKKGCGHCKTNDDFQADMIVFENGNEKVEVQLCFGMLEIIHKKDEEVIYHVDTDINYCPMCGKKLGGDKYERETGN